jgi:hypothetical protein
MANVKIRSDVLEMLKRSDEIQDKDALLKLIQSEITSDVGSDEIDVGELIEDLKDALASYNLERDFESEDLVVWKDNLKNRRHPKYGQPAIVVKILDEPIQTSDETSSSAYFRENLDVQLGIFTEDREFVVFYYDSCRFSKYQQ